MTARTIAPASGRLGVLLPGLGAVASTLIAGVLQARQSGSAPIGSLTQMAQIRLGDRAEGRNPLIKDFVPLAALDDLVFGGWDPISPDALEAARTAGVLEERDIAPISAELEGVVAMDAVFDQDWVSRLDGTRVKSGATKLDLAQALMDDIERFRVEQECDRLVMVWCASTEAYRDVTAVHQSVEAFEAGLAANDPMISPSQIYAYAAIMSRVPYANGAPNLSSDLPCMIDLAERNGVPIGGKDFKTGQTLMKTIVAPGLKARMLGLNGWFSTNILGTATVEVLDDPENFRSKDGLQAGRAGHDPPARGLSRAVLGHLPCGEDQLLPTAGRQSRRGGTASTSSGGWATRCRSRSTSCAGTRSWPRRWCSTSPCSSTWLPGRVRPECRSGSSFYFKAPMTSRPDRTPSTTSSSSRSS